MRLRFTGGIVPNLIAFSLFLEAIGYFYSTGKMAAFSARKTRNKAITSKSILKRDP